MSIAAFEIRVLLDGLAAVASSLTPADRKVLAAVAFLGLFETGYINAVKFGLVGDVAGRGGTAGLLCTGSSFACSEVLNGPWASVLGVPLTVPGNRPSLIFE